MSYNHITSNSDGKKRKRNTTTLFIFLASLTGLSIYAFSRTKRNNEITHVVSNRHIDFVYELIDKYGPSFTYDQLTESEKKIYDQEKVTYDALREAIADFQSNNIDASVIVTPSVDGTSYVVNEQYRNVLKEDVADSIDLISRSRKVDTSNQSDVDELNTFINDNSVPGIIFGKRSHAVYSVNSIVEIPAMVGVVNTENNSLGIVSQGQKIFVRFPVDLIDIKYIVSDTDRSIQDIWYDGQFYYYGQSSVIRAGADKVTLHSSDVRNSAIVTGWLQKFESKGKRKYKFFGKRMPNLEYKSRYMFTPNKIVKVGILVQFHTSGRAKIFRRVI